MRSGNVVYRAIFLPETSITLVWFRHNDLRLTVMWSKKLT